MPHRSDRDKDSLAGRLLSERYLIQRELGEGGMARVYLAEDVKHHRKVAVKVLRPELAAVIGRERFLHEIHLAAQLNNPHILPLHDSGESDGLLYYVMPVVEGESLRDLMNRQRQLPIDRAIRITKHIASALEHAHGQGIVHRDIKPENILLHDGEAMVTDFGIALAISKASGTRLTSTGFSLGTPHYMSPEQATGERELDARSDVYALGCVCFEMLAGEPPFTGNSAQSIIAKRITESPPNVSTLRGRVPPQIDMVVSKALATAPVDRYESASAFANALTEDRTAPATPAVAGMRRRWSVATLALVAAAITAASYLFLRSASNAQLSFNRVMVFPLAVPSGTNVPPSAGEDVATMIGTALNDTEPLKWIDAWPLLNGDARDDIRSLDIEQAARLAKSRGCGYFIWGRVVAGGDSVTVVLNLYDGANGSPVASAEGSGHVDAAWRAGLRAVSGLLPEMIETTVPDVEAGFAARPPAAVAQFLLGESAFRRAVIDMARQHFVNAFALDSTFALAGIRAAQLASWQHDVGDARGLLTSVLTLPLKPSAESFARGLLAFVDLDAEGAVLHLTSALSEDSTLTVAWAALGEVYRHRAPRQPWLNGPRPFARAIARDSLAGYVLFHRLEEVIRAGDLATAGALREVFLAGQPDSSLRRQVGVMYACLERGPRSDDWANDVRGGSPNVLYAAGQLLAAGGNLPCAEALFRAVLRFDTTAENAEPRYWAGLLGLTGSRLAQGRFADARRLINAAAAGFETFQSLIDRSTVDSTGVVLPAADEPWVPREVPLRSTHEESLTRWSELAILVGAVYPEMRETAALGAADIRSIAGPDYTGAPYRTSIWMLGLWEARQGRPDEAARAAAQLRVIANGQDDLIVKAYTIRMAEALDIHRLLAEGDESGALERLREFKTNAAEGWIFSELIGSFGLERLTQAMLEERIGDPKRALELVRGFDEPSSLTYVLYLPPALASCARTATRLGFTAQSRSCETRRSALGWSPEDF